MSTKTKFGTLTLNFGENLHGLNTLKPCKMVKIWTLNGIITGLPPAMELEQSSHEILDYMAQL